MVYTHAASPYQHQMCVAGAIPSSVRYAGGVGSTQLSNHLNAYGLTTNLLTDADNLRHVPRCVNAPGTYCSCYALVFCVLLVHPHCKETGSLPALSTGYCCIAHSSNPLQILMSTTPSLTAHAAALPQTSSVRHPGGFLTTTTPPHVNPNRPTANGMQQQQHNHNHYHYKQQHGPWVSTAHRANPHRSS